MKEKNNPMIVLSKKEFFDNDRLINIDSLKNILNEKNIDTEVHEKIITTLKCFPQCQTNLIIFDDKDYVKEFFDLAEEDSKIIIFDYMFIIVNFERKVLKLYFYKELSEENVSNFMGFLKDLLKKDFSFFRNLVFFMIKENKRYEYRLKYLYPNDSSIEDSEFKINRTLSFGLDKIQPFEKADIDGNFLVSFRIESDLLDIKYKNEFFEKRNIFTNHAYSILSEKSERTSEKIKIKSLITNKELDINLEIIHNKKGCSVILGNSAALSYFPNVPGNLQFGFYRNSDVNTALDYLEKILSEMAFEISNLEELKKTIKEKEQK